MKMQNKPHQRLRRRPSPAGVALLLLLLGGVGLWLPWRSIVPARLQDNLVDLLQIHGRWLGFLPITFEPMPEWQYLTTPRRNAAITGGPLHPHPTNPRYFTNESGRVIYLAGLHTWPNLQDMGDSDPPPVFDYTAYLDLLADYHINFFRLWIMEQARWGSWNGIDGFRFAPHPYVRTGSELALDGKPKFDLNQFNQAYFDRMRQRIEEASQRGIYVSIMLFDGWSIEDKGLWGNNPWRGHPFHPDNNSNGINGDPNKDGQGLEIQTLALPAVTALQEAYVRQVIDTVNDLDNVLYEISNEGSALSTEWQYHMITYIKTYEAAKPKQHPVGMTVQWRWPNDDPNAANQVLFDSPADWISPAGELYNRPLAKGDKVILADTDHLCGICGDRMWVWHSFMSGENPVFMDVWNCAPWWYPGDCNRASWPGLRRNLGYTFDYANRINLATMRPQADLSSTKLLLANAVASNAEYLTYLPEGGAVTVDLSATPGELNSEWFNPETGATTDGGVVTGGASRSFTAPFVGDAVLYLYQKPAEPTFRLYLPVAGQGAVSVVPAGPYTAGQPVTLSAVPAPGWAFTAWKGDVAGLTTPLVLTMTQDITITALFVPDAAPFTYTVTLRIVGNGAVALMATGPFTQGQTMQITALPDPSWTFTGWSGNLRGPLHALTTTITNPLNITATFATNQSFIPTVVSE